MLRKACLLIFLVMVSAAFAQDFYFDEASGVLSVSFNDITWWQIKPAGAKVINHAWASKNVLNLTIAENGKEAMVQWQFNHWPPELRFKVTSKDNSAIAYPWPFVRETFRGEELLLPVAEGILYDAEDQSVRPYDWLKGYAGYGTSLPLFGMVNARGDGYGFFTETPDYYELLVSWQGVWTVTPNWQPGENNFGERTGRFRFFQEDAVVKIAKWYRSYLQKGHLFVPLEKKKTKNADPRALVATPQVWVWSDPVQTALFLDSLGIDHALLANVDPKYWTVNKEVIDQLHQMGYLTGKYDNYEDRWPANLSGITEWTEGYPEGLVKTKDGKFVPAWEMTGPDGKSYVGAKLCSAAGKKLIEQDLPDELSQKPYTSRFIDTLPATELRTCFNPLHPQDRSGDRVNRTAILEFSSRYVLTGAEKGTWWAIAPCHYLHGMLSLNPYPPADDIGANPSRPLNEVKPDYLRFDVSPVHRIPFFGMVARDAVLPTWYWGDGNNKHTGTWREKDLFTVLYGGMPMWCFATLDDMRKYAKELKNSYDFVRPGLKAVGLSELVSYKTLTPLIQQTFWSNGVVITANFSDQTETFVLGGKTIKVPPKSYIVTKK